MHKSSLVRKNLGDHLTLSSSSQYEDLECEINFVIIQEEPELNLEQRQYEPVARKGCTSETLLSDKG